MDLRLGRDRTKSIARHAATAAACAIVLFGAALRVRALTETYGVVTPGWLGAAQTSTSRLVHVLEPATVHWPPADTYPHLDGPETHYRSDPYTYLKYAREMRHFYGAHYREPVFVFATKIWLRALGNRDVAVSVASMMFAVFALATTYLVGTMAFSPIVGLIAAAAFAIEYTAIAWDIAGWRDQAFMFALLAFAGALIGARRTPSLVRVGLVGATAALAVLVRVTALSCVVPGFLWLALVSAGPWHRRLRQVGVAAAVAVALSAPYFVNCWRVYGDPLYAINALTVNLPLDAAEAAAKPSAVGYVTHRMATRPFRTIDTMVLGLTVAAFENKWDGFAPWWPGAGPCLRILAIGGLVLFLGSSSGRLFLLLLVTSRVPFAFTWPVVNDWRYTEHAYPFFLIAAALVIWTCARAIAPREVRRRIHAWRTTLRPIAIWSVVIALIAVVAALDTWGLPVLMAREALATDRVLILSTDFRNEVFFRHNWSAPITIGNVTARVSTGPRSTVTLPLPGVDDYFIILRLDPDPRPDPDASGPFGAVRVSINGTALSTVELAWNPTRVGSYEMVLPRAAVRRGSNELALEIEHRPGSSSSSFRLWYVLIRPALPEEISRGN